MWRYIVILYLPAVLVRAVGGEMPPALKKALDTIQNENSRPQQVREAIISIRKLRHKAKPAVPILVSLLNHPDTRNIRYPARDTLLSIGAVCVPELVKVLGDDSRAEPAVWVLWRIVGYQGKGISELLSLLKVGSLKEKKRAVRCLRLAAGVKAQRVAPALPGLVESLQTSDKELCTEVIRAIGAIGSLACSAVPELVKLFGEEDEESKYHSALAIARIGATAVPALIEELKKAETSRRRYSCFALARIGEEAKSAVPILIGRLKDSEVVVRRNSADALGHIGDASAVPALLSALSDKSPEVRAEAFESLLRFEEENPRVKAELERYRRHLLKRKPIKRYETLPPADGGLFPSEPIPGYPGADGKERPVWGWPERLPYPGSVEHFRTMTQKYLPADPIYDVNSLVKNFLAWKLSGIKRNQVESFEEPVYYLPMYGVAERVGQKRPPVKVVRWTPNSPPFRIKLGKLKPSYYVLRVIACIETKDVRPSPKPLIMRFRVNDQPDGSFSTATRRLRAVDNFYSVAEWYFRAYDGRSFRVELSLVEGTEVDLLVHNIDLHDLLAHIPRLHAKPGPTLYPLRERENARREFAEKAGTAEYDKAFRRSWGTGPPTRPYRREPLTAEERIRRDRELWFGLPPMNTQYNDRYGKMNEATPEEIKSAKEKGIEDKGWGVYFPETQNYWTPVANKMSGSRRRYQYEITPMDGTHPASQAVLRYYFTGEREAARDMAFMLCRIAYLMPTWDMRHSIQNVVSRPEQCWGREQTLRRRARRWTCYRPIKLIQVYDMLYDFIEGNEELAVAVGRFIPDIKTPEDLLSFLDTNLLQFIANLIMRYQIYSDHETPVKMITCATAQSHLRVTRPWMEWLFTRTWDYPQPLSGIQDYMNTATTRDGTTYIGSWFYTASGGRGIDMAVNLERYIKAGGDPKYSLTDFRRYPKVMTSCYWVIEGRVAGLYPMEIGDVGGPSVSHGHWLDSAERGIRLGWRWTKDPLFAYPLKYIFGRKGESDEDWRKIEELATKERNPWFANHSRVLSAWAGVLESGTQHDDFRFRRAVTVRVGNGWGHAHNDTLDLNLWAHGCIMAGDGGQRPGYGHPECYTTFIHNVVEVDGDGHHRGRGNWRGYSWIRTLAPAPSAQFLLAESFPPDNHRDVKLFRRYVALVDVDEGKPSAQPITPHMMLPEAKLPTDVITPSSYIFDVFRVSGGKVHTYCFHGGQNDLLETNAKNIKPLSELDPESFESLYLRKFDILPERRWVGEGVEHFIATWRLSRDPVNFTHRGKTHTVRGAEPANMGKSFDPSSPRKFTRLHLLGEPSARILRGTWFNSPYTLGYRLMNWFDCIFVQKRSEESQESAFVALIEPYAGEPFIEDCKLLEVLGNESDARRAVAVQVEIKENAEVGRMARTDICFSDGRPDRVRTVSRMKLSGEFAFVSTDKEGLRQATLVGGTVLETPYLSIKLPLTHYTATIETVDYLGRKALLDKELPSKLLGRTFAEVGNPDHWTSLEVSRIEGNTLHFRKGVELVTTRVVSVDEEKAIVRGRLGVPVLGIEERVNGKLLQHPLPGLEAGLTASNDNRTRFFKCEFLGGNRQEGYEYRLTGATVRRDDFPVHSALRVYEFGPGDTLRITSFASLRRVQKGLYELSANTPLTLSLRGESVEVSPDQKGWQRLEASPEGGRLSISLPEELLTTPLYLRLR